MMTSTARHPANVPTSASPPIPAAYRQLPGDEIDARIAAAKDALGERLVILGHHYQRDSVVKFADFQGDSFKLSRLAASRREAEFIVFCGVHFMAESADILSADGQIAILPNMAAGCTMADMADAADVQTCWSGLANALGSVAGPDGRLPVLPITYVNSAASLKAFCGREGGAVCTSSNARGVVKWALGQAERVLFFPDQHLGRNTALGLGFAPEEIVVWDPCVASGGLTADQIERARFIVWRGCCSLHMRFAVEQIAAARAAHPDVSVVVHPECRHEVVAAADLAGSTEYICKVIREAPTGTKWAVGTEVNLVRRLAAEMPDKLIWCLDPVYHPCPTMHRIRPADLCWVLESLVEGRIVNQVKVDPETARAAKVALDRMLAIVG
jgi:quinolinate synthase